MTDIDMREKIEWLNYWIEEANQDRKRIILIGDSVTRETRKKLNSFMKRKYVVDLMAMSYGILDNKAFEEIQHFFQTTSYKYDVIIYQMGAHHGYHIDCLNIADDAVRFANRTKKILEFLSQQSKNTISMSATLERCIGAGGEEVPNHNDEIEKRNQILKEVSDELNLFFFDLNNKIDYKKLRYTNWCHFHEDCYEYISKLIICEIFPDIKCVSSNRIMTIEKMEEKLKSCAGKKIYIYGNGVRGKNVKRYLQKQNYIWGGYIVSKEYMDSSDDIYSIEQIKKNDTLIIVTPVEASIWEKLFEEDMDYISLSSDVYEAITWSSICE